MVILLKRRKMRPQKEVITMKKWMVICIAVAMVFAMTWTAFAAQQNIDKSKAKSIALKNAKTIKTKVRAMKTDYDAEDNVWEIEFIKKKNGANYEYDISAADGRILEKSVDYKYKHNSSKKKIGKKQARKKVAKFSGIKLSTIKKGTCWYEYDDRQGTYEVKFRKGNYRYDYEVLAPTGKIIEYSYKYVR